jgi:protein-L-isoaspartate(D-aspartate) O-methyltransferase
VSTPDLARRLTSRGVIIDPQWHRALLAVDRRQFLPDAVWMPRRDDSGLRERLPANHRRVQETVYEDYAIITQVEGGKPGGAPSSSISQPSLVLACLQALDVHDGQRVLEIGTGTGYNTALLCERLGADNVVSVEVDPEVAAQAAQHLADTGHKPLLIVGDGAEEVHGGPFDRVLATVAAHRVPAAWITQVRPGGVIVTPWTTRFALGVLLRLVVADDGTASGRFVGSAPYMVLRSQRRAGGDVEEFIREDDPDDPAVQGTTDTNPRVITHRDPGWELVVGHLVPGIDYASWEAKDESGEASVYAIDRGGTNTWVRAEYTPSGGPYATEGAGPRDLWGEIGAAWEVWQGAGRPGRDRLGLTVTAEGEHLLWVDEPGHVLVLPGG